MTEFTTVIELARYVKSVIDAYNIAKPEEKSTAHANMCKEIQDILAVPKNRSLIYKGDNTAVVFSKTLGQWRMRIWNEISKK